MAIKENSAKDRAFGTIVYIILGIILVTVTYPLIYIFSSSISNQSDVIAGNVWLWPVGFNLEAYKAIVAYPNLWITYGNTVFYTVTGTAISVVLTIMAGFPLSRKDFRARNFYMLIIAFTMWFNGGLIPFYMVVRDLNMLNTRWAIILPMALSAWNIIITRTFFTATIPDTLVEAARLDGCSDYKFIIRIVLPLSGAIIAVNVLFYGVYQWNAYFHAMLFLTDNDLYPLQILLRRILINNNFDESFNQAGADSSSVTQESRQTYRQLVKYALIIIASVPVLIVYPFLQKYFIKGVMIGSIKG